MITLIEVPRLSQHQAAITAAYRASMSLQEAGWMRFPAVCWDKPAIVAMDGDRCVGALNYHEEEEELAVWVDFAFALPSHPKVMAVLLSRFRRLYQASQFEVVRFTCHPGNLAMVKAVSVLSAEVVSSTYRIPMSRLATVMPVRPAAPDTIRLQTGAHFFPDWLLRVATKWRRSARSTGS